MTTQTERRKAYYAAVKAERAAQLNLRESAINVVWHEKKMKHPDAIVLFRVGDFYEAYGEDATAIAEPLGLVLTTRRPDSDSPVKLVGFPYHALDTYLPKLVRKGFRVVITEEFADLPPVRHDNRP